MYKYVATFVGGAVIGALGTLLWLRKEYNKKVEEAVIESNRKNQTVSEVQNTEEIEKKAEQKAYERLNKDLLKRHGYSSMDDAETSVRDNLPDSEKKETPYGISGEDFLMTKREYDKISLLYYDDGILACEDGTVVEDILYVIGPNWRDEVGKYDEDVAYIRNDRSGADYEVILEHANYSEMYGDKEE